ncbi:hypothetical protein H920_06626 [Fukomys damarensis]|uniref:Uncharacterized protein n=1 Tax=Fukomys damarensis TaxID=885580 RepID=A0A091DLS5_FUKDA|nr:hypothetical protein H920_06626 [Fukomys damarensis]
MVNYLAAEAAVRGTRAQGKRGELKAYLVTGARAPAIEWAAHRTGEGPGCQCRSGVLPGWYQHSNYTGAGADGAQGQTDGGHQRVRCPPDTPCAVLTQGLTGRSPAKTLKRKAVNVRSLKPLRCGDRLWQPRESNVGMRNSTSWTLKPVRRQAAQAQERGMKARMCETVSDGQSSTHGERYSLRWRGRSSAFVSTHEPEPDGSEPPGSLPGQGGYRGLRLKGALNNMSPRRNSHTPSSREVLSRAGFP